MAHLFFGSKIDDYNIILDESEVKHCQQVLRHRVGDLVEVTCGDGQILEGRIEEISKKSVRLDLLRVIEDHGERPYLWLVVAPTKNQARIEWLIEKGTELGLRRFTPIVTAHSEKPRIRKDRLERIALAGVKQSRKGWLPVIDEMMTLEELLVSAEHEKIKTRFIGYCGEFEKRNLTEDYAPGSDVIVLIGPEGDFSEKEVELARGKGFAALDLGPDRFRTETAGTHIISFIYEVNRHAKIF